MKIPSLFHWCVLNLHKLVLAILIHNHTLYRFNNKWTHLARISFLALYLEWPKELDILNDSRWECFWNYFRRQILYYETFLSDRYLICKHFFLKIIKGFFVFYFLGCRFALTFCYTPRVPSGKIWATRFANSLLLLWMHPLGMYHSWQV